MKLNPNHIHLFGDPEENFYILGKRAMYPKLKNEQNTQANDRVIWTTEKEKI